MILQFLKNRFIVNRLIKHAKQLLKNLPDDSSLALRGVKIGLLTSWIKGCRDNDVIKDLWIKDIEIHMSKLEIGEKNYSRSLKSILIIQVSEWGQSNGFFMSDDLVDMFLLYHDLMAKAQLWEPGIASKALLAKENLTRKLEIRT
jgi:hypothetical protein|tara:strand:+ start:632 stop:1066 length:435 start_codon:yes stop_codon:yes gene_type:complete